MRCGVPFFGLIHAMQSNDDKEMNLPEPENAAGLIGKYSSQNQEVVEEYGGSPGPEPTRYGDWEKNGRCIDF